MTLFKPKSLAASTISLHGTFTVHPRSVKGKRRLWREPEGDAEDEREREREALPKYSNLALHLASVKKKVSGVP